MSGFKQALSKAERLISGQELASNFPSSYKSSFNSQWKLNLFAQRCQDQAFRHRVMDDFLYAPKLQKASYHSQAATLPVTSKPLADLSFLLSNIKKLIASRHPMLNTMASYYFSGEGKQLRPLLVLLVGQASNPNKNDSESMSKHYTLASIIELIHTASLIHDDVLDRSSTRRLLPTLHTQSKLNVDGRNVEFQNGNKLAILCGDYLLSRASVALAGLQNLDVVKSVADIIGSLVEGEVLQMYHHDYSDSSDELALEQLAMGTEYTLRDIQASRLPLDKENNQLRPHFTTYIRKTYLKTASLMAQACLAAVQLNDQTTTAGHVIQNQDQCNLHYQSCAAQYGRHLGIAFQIIDDLMDYTCTDAEMGKPSHSDLQNGIITAPLLYAASQNKSLISVVERMALNDAKTENIKDLMNQIELTEAFAMTRSLAQWHADQARKSILKLPQSEARSCLVDLCSQVINRVK